jgi:hypothetical protein
MPKWTLEEARTVIQQTGNHRWYPEHLREKIASARIAAFLYRQRHKRKLTAVSPSDKKGNRAANTASGAANRGVSKLARRIIVRAKRGAGLKAALECHPSLLLARRRDSIFLDGLLPNRRNNWVPLATRLKTQRTVRLRVENFSFLRNPTGTMEVLRSIAEAEQECISAQIDFMDVTCADIGPWLVLAMMRPDLAPIFTGGAISNQMSKVLDALRLKDQLRFSVVPSWEGERDIWAFPLHLRRAAGTSTSPTVQLDPQAKEKAGHALCAAISTWLSECAGQELTNHGRRLVKKITGECLDNAERHSRREFENDGDWMLTGFMEKVRVEGGHHFRCQLAFLSIGSSISETVEDCAPETLRDMKAYVATHRSSMPNHRSADGHLRTIFALQDMVTRDRDAFAEGRGGTGFRDIICLFWDLAGGEGDATLSVVSGQTCLIIDNSFRDLVFPRRDETFNIWFNDTNDHTKPPDHAMVKELDSDFRGALITMGFTLDVGYLEQTADGDS